jgi:hypothetical protein
MLSFDSAGKRTLDPEMRRSSETKRRSNAYGRMFSAFAFGMFHFVAGLIGYHLDTFATTRWSPTPILWQVALGAGFLALGVFYYRRLPEHDWLRRHVAHPMRSVGAGRSAGAERGAQSGRLPRGRG